MPVKAENGSLNLLRCIVRIDDINGRPQGTGFLIAGRRVVTCAHVISAAQARPGDYVNVVFPQEEKKVLAKVASEYWQPEADVALLEIEAPLPKTSARAYGYRSSKSGRQEFHTLGYPPVGKIDGVRARGTILGPVFDDNRRYLQLDSKEITQGFSGAPVLLPGSNLVAGMVTTVYLPGGGSPKLRDAAFAIPAETIASIIPTFELKRFLWQGFPRRVLAFGLGLVVMLLAIVGLVLSQALAPPPAFAEFEVFDHHLINQIKPIRQIAAGNGNIWFAGSKGLVWLDSSSLQGDLVTGAGDGVSAIAVDSGGTHAWFALPNGRVFSYLVNRTKPAAPLEAELRGAPAFDGITTILVDRADGNGAWFGDLKNGISHYQIEKGWSTPPPSTASVNAPRMAISILPDPNGALWINGKVFVYRFHNDQWAVFNSDSTFNHLQNTVTAIQVDQMGRIWFGDNRGLTVLASGADSLVAGDQSWRSCRADQMPVIPGKVLSLAVSNQGLGLWVASEAGLARIDLDSSGNLPEDCNRWRWEKIWEVSPTLKKFWTDKIQIAITENHGQDGKDHLVVWVINPQAEPVLYLNTAGK
jgi:hypothetical protein